MHRTFEELSLLGSFEERFHYLALNAGVGVDTFGHERWLNQDFYASTEWRHIRQYVIARDEGMDLGTPDRPIHDRIYIHHMNPLSREQIIHGDPATIDPRFLITTRHSTHNAIHYGGDVNQLPRPYVERRPGDTKLW